MTDLNVTKGEWTVTKYGYEKYSINGENGKEVASAWLGDNAHLIAQAKNMYKELEDFVNHACCDDIETARRRFIKLMDACKPPEE